MPLERLKLADFGRSYLLGSKFGKHEPPPLGRCHLLKVDRGGNLFYALCES